MRCLAKQASARPSTTRRIATLAIVVAALVPSNTTGFNPKTVLNTTSKALSASSPIGSTPSSSKIIATTASTVASIEVRPSVDQ